MNNKDKDGPCSGCSWRTVAMVALIISVMCVVMVVAHAIFDAKEFQTIREHISEHHPEPAGKQ